jgi:HIV Tat-specific factor 1
VISAKPSDPLDAFKHEIEAVEQAGALGLDPDSDADAAADAGDADAADREGTPEELEFEDDDGTIYKWDHQLRKYMPAGEVPEGDSTAAAAAMAEQQQQQDGDGYNIEAMTFVAEEEVIPTLAAVKAAEEAAAAGSSGGKGRKVCWPNTRITISSSSSGRRPQTECVEAGC